MPTTNTQDAETTLLHELQESQKPGSKLDSIKCADALVEYSKHLFQNKRYQEATGLLGKAARFVRKDSSAGNLINAQYIQQTGGASRLTWKKSAISRLSVFTACL